VLGAFEYVGFSILPLLSVMERVPFVYYIDGKSNRKLEKGERLLIVCGVLRLEDIEFLATVGKSETLSAITTLMDSEEVLELDEPIRSPLRSPFDESKEVVPYLSLYTLEELRK